jgi:hypothetical protein
MLAVKAVIRILVVASLPLALAANGPPKGCLAGMQKTLVEQGFEPVFCSKKDTSFVLIGRTAGSGFSIHNYRYRFRPYAGAASMHGGQRLVVMRGNQYVGQYMLLPNVAAAVRGRHVMMSCSKATGIGNRSNWTFRGNRQTGYS